MATLEEMVKDTAKKVKALSPAETEVFNTIIDYLDTLPEDFFKQSVKALNEHFGGHDDMVVTEAVRSALDGQMQCERMLDAMADLYDSLPEEDEEDEEE